MSRDCNPLINVLFNSKFILFYFQAGIYYIFSIILGFAASLAWGIIFGMNTLLITWVAQPFIKLFFTWMRLFGVFLRALMRSLMDPFWQSMGLVFSSIRGKITMSAE